MSFIFDHRPSDSPFVETIWSTQSEHPGSFASTAAIHSGMVVMRHNGKTILSVRGPETKVTPADFPAGAEWCGIIFKLGTYMPHLPPKMVMDRHEVNLPEASSKSFWLHGSAWQFPDFENVDTFIDRLVRERLLVRDPVVDAALQGQLLELSQRSIQYRFLRATGLTHNLIRQIQRAQRARTLLQQGVSILDTVYEAGYADQSHLTRSVKRFMGQTPAQIAYVLTPE
jgi:AraC-like DNA-binding protein